MELCECCQCTPCDCHGVNDEEYEFWGMGQDGSEQVREDYGMDVKGNQCQPVHPIEVAPGGYPQNRVFSEGVPSPVKNTKKTTVYSHEGGCFIYWS